MAFIYLLNNQALYLRLILKGGRVLIILEPAKHLERINNAMKA